MRRGLRFIVLIREDLKVKPFADVITKAALSPHLFKTFIPPSHNAARLARWDKRRSAEREDLGSDLNSGSLNN